MPYISIALNSRWALNFCFDYIGLIDALTYQCTYTLIFASLTFQDLKYISGFETYFWIWNIFLDFKYISGFEIYFWILNIFPDLKYIFPDLKYIFLDLKYISGFEIYFSIWNIFLDWPFSASVDVSNCKQPLRYFFKYFSNSLLYYFGNNFQQNCINQYKNRFNTF